MQCNAMHLGILFSPVDHLLVAHDRLKPLQLELLLEIVDEVIGLGIHFFDIFRAIVI